MSNMKVLDLDASRREVESPDGIKVVLGGIDFILPAELPVDIIDPLLNEDFDLVGMIRDLADSETEAKAAGQDWSLTEAVLQMLFDRPNLPLETLNVIHGCLGVLFGEDAYAEFRATRPSFNDYGRLVRGLFSLYGVGLGEAFASAGSSETDGQTQKPTSPSTTDSTSEVSGDAPEPAPAS